MVAGLRFEASGKLNKRLIQIMDEMRESFNQQKRHETGLLTFHGIFLIRELDTAPREDKIKIFYYRVSF